MEKFATAPETVQREVRGFFRILRSEFSMCKLLEAEMRARIPVLDGYMPRMDSAAYLRSQKMVFHPGAQDEESSQQANGKVLDELRKIVEAMLFQWYFRLCAKRG